MTAERVFNLFIYFVEGVAREYGIRHHRIAGSDDDKMARLRTMVDADQLVARRLPLSRTFTPEQWRAVHRQGGVLRYFEEGFILYHARADPIFCLTPVVDGKVRVDTTIGSNPFRGDQVTAEAGRGSVPDYLVNYLNGTNFRFTDLIHDDYFKAIRSLFNERLYVSCAKLLMSCIDTLAFVEFGDVAGNFPRWVDTYVELAGHGIESEELWEFRNSVLHMTNLSSRKVTSGKVSPIMPYVGAVERLPAGAEGSPKPFNLYGLITSVGEGIGRWAASYNVDRDKMLLFIERYDLTISDSRMAWFSVDTSKPGEGANRSL